MNYTNILIKKCKKNKGFFQKVVHLYHLVKTCFRSTEAPAFFNLFNSRYLYCQRGRLAHSLKMSTGHFLYALPSHKLKNSGTSVIFSRPYVKLIKNIFSAYMAVYQTNRLFALKHADRRFPNIIKFIDKYEY